MLATDSAVQQRLSGIKSRKRLYAKREAGMCRTSRLRQQATARLAHTPGVLTNPLHTHSLT